ncbi:MAG: redoxin domain-containing protein [Bacteroidia bacterium]|jgi:thiol-disulfide isomerase/thioredoxin
MKSVFIFCFLIICLNGNGFGQQIKPVDATWIKDMRKLKSDTVYVINFWATWCKPCVTELPELDKIKETYQAKAVKVILVSNDMRKGIEQKLISFIRERHIKSSVYWMNEPDANSWINLVDSSWSGAIPATWIIQPNTAFHFFNEGEVNFEQLKQVVDANVK